MGYIGAVLGIVCMVLLLIHILVQRRVIDKYKNSIKTMEKTKHMIYSVSKEVSLANKKQEAFSILLNAAIELIPGACKGSILMKGNNHGFEYVAVQGYSEELKLISLELEEIFLYKLNGCTETAVIEDPMNFDEKVVQKAKHQKLKSIDALNISCVMSSPIFIDDEFVGLINVDSIDPKYVFTKEEVELMDYINSELTLSLKNFLVKEKLRYMANYDDLTGLYNRRFFKKLFDKELKKIKGNNLNACFAVLDIDNFKSINDNYGHNTGDEALKFFSNVLRENINEGHIYSRISGDEFVILFINCTKETAVKKLEDIKTVLRERQTNRIKIEFSYGICDIHNNRELEPDDIFIHADNNMYANKNANKINDIITSETYIAASKH